MVDRRRGPIAGSRGRDGAASGVPPSGAETEFPGYATRSRGWVWPSASLGQLVEWLATIRSAGRRASSTVWFTQSSQRGLRGNRRTRLHPFISREAYEGFLESCIQARNATRQRRIEEERGHLRALPTRPLPAYRESYATVSRCTGAQARRLSPIRISRGAVPHARVPPHLRCTAH